MVQTRNLKESLRKLHAHLEETEEVDSELKSLLQVLDSDIHHLLGEDKPDVLELNSASLAERTQAISAKFAAQHPQIEPMLRELGTILANIGI